MDLIRTTIRGAAYIFYMALLAYVLILGLQTYPKATLSALGVTVFLFLSYVVGRAWEANGDY